MSEAAFALAAPEVYLPSKAAEKLVPYAPSLMMALPIIVALLMIIIAVIMLSTMQSKLPGGVLLLLGLLIGGGAFWVIHKNATSVARKTV